MKIINNNDSLLQMSHGAEVAKIKDFVFILDQFCPHGF